MRTHKYTHARARTHTDTRYVLVKFPFSDQPISGAISAGHDRSDGGLACLLLEMAFAGQVGCGLDVDVPAAGDGVLDALFSEEVCIVFGSLHAYIHAYRVHARRFHFPDFLGMASVLRFQPHVVTGVFFAIDDIFGKNQHRVLGLLS